LAGLSPELRNTIAFRKRLDDENDPRVDAELQKLIDNFPKSTTETYYLTHADLNFANIMVDEYANVTAIIDWESAGYYPWWAERWFLDRLEGIDSPALELFSMAQPPLWGDQPTRRQFDKEVIRPVLAVSNTFGGCRTKHDSQNTWRRPPFSTSRKFPQKQGKSIK